MDYNEISIWNRNVKLFESIERLVSTRSKSEGRPISFYEGLTTYLADGFLDSKLFDAPYGYLPQRAA